jgi:hypothetical protein
VIPFWLPFALPVLLVVITLGETNLIGWEIWHAKRNRRQRR